MKRYYSISGVQLFMMALLVGVISSAITTINMSVKEYLLLPEVVMTKEGKCGAVINYRNGDAFNCADVGVILRNHRTKTE